jgi:hypothetical protein
MDARIASSATHQTCYVAPDAAGEKMENLIAVFK